MYAITGITGQVGAQVAEALLAARQPVRAVVRSIEKGAPWAARGCEVAVVQDAVDMEALADSLSNCAGAFLMSPPNYDPEPGFPDTRRVADVYVAALVRASPGRAVVLSSVGAQVERFNLLNNAGILERALSAVATPCAFLRPAWFIENSRWDLADARVGRIESFLQPLDRAIDMVSVKDIGHVAAQLLREDWDGTRIVELRGPAKVRPQDLADGFAAALDGPVKPVTVPHEEWERRFRAQGMRHPEARIAMLDGFNQGWLAFEGGDVETRIGQLPAATILAEIAAPR